MAEKALVTGASGFIGGHLTEALLEAGWEVRALEHYHAEPRSRWIQQRDPTSPLEILRGDIGDPHQTARIVHGIDVVFHLAALVGIPYSYEAPQSYIRTNVEGTLNLAMAARDAGVARFVLMSTSEVYGEPQYTPIDEAHPLQARSPYSASKIAAEKIVESLYLSFELPAVIVRAFNTYGPRQSARAVLPTIIAQALAGPVVRLGALGPVRDLTYVTDTVAGLLAAADSDVSVGRVFNLGTGSGAGIEDLAHRVFALLGGEHRIEQDSARMRPPSSEIHVLLSDNRRARTKLGWEPRVGLDEGLERTIAWIREHVDLYRPDEYAR